MICAKLCELCLSQIIASVCLLGLIFLTILCRKRFYTNHKKNVAKYRKQLSFLLRQRVNTSVTLPEGYKAWNTFIFSNFIDELWISAHKSSDVVPDPDSFGTLDSGPHSESGSGSRGVKWREKQSLTNIFFRRKLYISSLNLKK